MDTATQATDDAHLQPDASVVLQQEAVELGTIPVCVQDVHGPVRTQALPRKAGSTRTITAGTTPVRILRANHWRASVDLVADGDIYFAFSQASAQDRSTMAYWPAKTVKTVSATVALWVCAATGTATVSVSPEHWAEGD